jgi:hypothetical protein
MSALSKLMPDLVRLGSSLLAKHNNDADAALVELKEITDHGARYQSAHARIEAEMAARHGNKP